MEFKDYYATLGVTKSSTDKEIKQAFRKLARKYHPDVNPGDKAAESKFKEINEAQAVLTDPEKRRKYDALGPDWQKRFRPGAYRTGSGQPAYTYTSSEGVGDFSDFFETLFGQRGGAQTRTQTPGGGGFDFDLGSLFGRGRGRKAESRRGSDVEQPVEVTLREALEG